MVAVLSCQTPPDIRNGHYETIPPYPWPTGTNINISCDDGYKYNEDLYIDRVECVLDRDEAIWSVAANAAICIPGEAFKTFHIIVKS